MFASFIHHLLAITAAVRLAILSLAAGVRGRTTALIGHVRDASVPQVARAGRIHRTIADHPLPTMAARVPKAAKRVARIAVLTYAVVVTGVVPSWVAYGSVAYAGLVIVWHFYKAWRDKAVVDAANPLWGQLKTAWAHP